MSDSARKTWQANRRRHRRPESAAAATRLLMHRLLSYGRFGPRRPGPLLIRDRRAARQGLAHILISESERVGVAHGDVLESGGREAGRHRHVRLLAA